MDRAPILAPKLRARHAGDISCRLQHQVQLHHTDLPDERFCLELHNDLQILREFVEKLRVKPERAGYALISYCSAHQTAGCAACVLPLSETPGSATRRKSEL